jgi:hypothetical protein
MRGIGMKTSRETFKKQTEDALGRCAAYLEANKGRLADQLCAMPSKEWSIEFRAGDDGTFPWIEVRTRQQNVDTIDAYMSANCQPESF